jgi:hypothetical protein
VCFASLLSCVLLLRVGIISDLVAWRKIAPCGIVAAWLHRQDEQQIDLAFRSSSDGKI